MVRTQLKKKKKTACVSAVGTSHFGLSPKLSRCHQKRRKVAPMHANSTTYLASTTLKKRQKRKLAKTAPHGPFSTHSSGETGLRFSSTPEHARNARGMLAAWAADEQATPATPGDCLCTTVRVFTVHGTGVILSSQSRTVCVCLCVTGMYVRASDSCRDKARGGG